MKQTLKQNSALIIFTAFFCCIFLFINPVNLNAQVFEVAAPENITFNLNLSSYLTGSGAYYFQQKETHGGFETWLNANINGNLGNNVSYSFDIGVALINIKRELLEKDVQMMVLNSNDTGTLVDIYNYPLAYFPYTYRSSWTGFVFPISALNAGGPNGWPDTTSIGFNIGGGISGNALNNVFKWYIGRTEREAMEVIEGYSLALNKFAQPFLGYDLEFNLFPWLSLYHVTGILEYFSSKGIQKSAATHQNGFSLTMISLKYGDYIQADVGSSAIWPKRFELGYLLPGFHLLYKNALGDFDNMALFGNIKLGYPDLGFLWFSLYVDEMNFEKDFFNLGRQMYAFQAGAQYQISFLDSGLLTLSYTKIEPYCYTHQKVKVPWYDQMAEQAYTNHGYGLGYYLPPNSDELKLMLAVNTAPQTELNLQFQMIRHGAEYGEHLVYGSSYQSELQVNWRSTDPRLRKDFLNDGAYQWIYVLKTGVQHSINSIPALGKLQLSFSVNAGIVISNWKLNGVILDTVEYPSRTGIIFNAGLHLAY